KRCDRDQLRFNGLPGDIFLAEPLPKFPRVDSRSGQPHDEEAVEQTAQCAPGNVATGEQDPGAGFRLSLRRGNAAPPDRHPAEESAKEYGRRRAKTEIHAHGYRESPYAHQFDHHSEMQFYTTSSAGGLNSLPVPTSTAKPISAANNASATTSFVVPNP